MTSATEIVRRMLDERGVEHEGGKRSVRWRDRNGVMMQAFPLANGELGMGVWSCTPEQAIAATLGATDANPTQTESSGTCHMVLREDIRGHAYQDTYECSECGEEVVRETCMGESEPPNFCPNCGKVVEPTTNDVDAEATNG